MVEKLREYLNSLSEEELEQLRKDLNPESNVPKGWIDVEEHLPKMYAIDIMQGYTEYKVKDKDGDEFYTTVSDHNTWYYYAKDVGITHWFND